MHIVRMSNSYGMNVIPKKDVWFPRFLILRNQIKSSIKGTSLFVVIIYSRFSWIFTKLTNIWIDFSMEGFISMILDFWARAIHLQISVMQGIIFNFLIKCKSASSYFETKFRMLLKEPSIYQ